MTLAAAAEPQPHSASDPVRRNNSLSRRLVVAVLLVNAAFTLLASAVQLYAAYDRGGHAVLATADTVDASFRRNFEQALSESNDALVRALLEAVGNKSAVTFAVLTAADGASFVDGDQAAPTDATQRLTLFHPTPSGEPVQIGVLELGLTLHWVNQSVMAQFWAIVASNLVKAALATASLFVLFNRVVTQPLAEITEHVTCTPWLDAAQPLQLSGPQGQLPHELGEIVTAINTAQRRAQTDFAVLGREIAQRREAEKQLQSTVDQLRQANREQAEFTYAISHDLKSPSNTILMLLEEAQVELATGKIVVATDFIESAKRTNNRMSLLIDDVLAYTRTVGDEIVFQPVSLDQLITATVEDLEGEISKSGAAISFAGLPQVRGNPTQLRLLVMNLLTNAMKYCSPHRPCRIDIWGEQSQGTDEVILHVRDNGIGIEEQYLNRIFGMFQRLHTHEVYPGSGLGLATCQRVVSNHRGCISVTSTLGQGSTFCVTLPKGA